ncbi:hypothetical protein B0O80DRAFT_81337 [Mortierella sp. GBAus27b]|nr:hypothetical protein B0O80DRAFT_81337 [Mortierella sp. GBAus27b]
MCPPCGADEECVLVPATCNDCGSGFCKKKEPLAPKVAPKNTKGCIKCFAPPMCPPCEADEECVLVPATCNDCGSGFCKKKEPLVPKVADAKKVKGCIKCFAPPMCPPCEADEECVLVPATCNDCGSGFCKKKQPLAPKAASKNAKGKTCVQCFAAPSCPPCAKDEKCVIIPATCDDCGSGHCEKL